MVTQAVVVVAVAVAVVEIEMKRKCSQSPFFTIQWHLTDTCDQRCQHCYIYNTLDNSADSPTGRKTEISLKQSIQILDKFQAFCERMNFKPSIVLTGGDPLLFPHFWDLVKILQSRGLKYSILGNPFHLNQNICDRLEDTGCHGYQMSIDGLETTHDKFRKQGSFQSTLKGFELLKKTKIQTVIMSTVSKENANEIPEVAKLACEIGVSTYAFARYCPTVGDFESNMTPLEYRDFLEKLYQLYEHLVQKYQTKLRFKDHLWTLLLHEKGVTNLTLGGNRIMGGCGMGRKHITVLPEGSVYACRRFESSLGSIFDKEFRELFFGKKMREYKSLDIAECKDCELLYHCRGCRAVAFGTSGNFLAKDPQCWKFAEKTFE